MLESEIKFRAFADQRHHQRKRRIFCMAISTYEKIGGSKICEKRKNGAECIWRYKNVNLNKIQRSNECVAQDKESLES